MNLQHSDSRRLEQYTQELLRMYQKRREILSHIESATADKGHLESTMSQADQNRTGDQLIASQTEGRMNNQPSQSIVEDRMSSQSAQSQTAARQNEGLLNNTEETVPTLLRDDETTMPSQGQVLSESEAESDHDAAMEEFLRENPSNGFIKVQAYSGLGAFPVKGVRIRITKEIGDKEIFFVNDVTDESGKTQARSLPAPNLSMSQTPGQPGALPPYSTYTLIAEKPDYITLIKRDLPIFPGVISIQPLEMLAVPKSQLTPPPIVDEEEEPNL